MPIQPIGAWAECHLQGTDAGRVPTVTNTLFDLLPIGAYRSTEDGRMLRSNQALVRLNGYETEAELIDGVNNIALEWYVNPGRREEFIALMKRDDGITNFVSEIYWHKSRKRAWIRENAHVVRGDDGDVLYFEGTVEDISAQHEAQLALTRSERLLRELADQVPGMLYRIVNPPIGPKRYLFVSSGARELYGVEPADLLANGSLLRDMRHPDDQLRVQEAVALAVQNRAPIDIEFRIVLRDGSLKWVHMSSNFAGEDEHGQVRNGIMLDVTARKLAEAEADASEARWKLALDSTGDGVWDWHIQAGREYYSQRYKEMYGYSTDKVWQPGDGYTDIVHPDDLAQLQKDQQAYFNHETPTYSNEHRVRCADGSWKWVLTRGMVIEWDAQGQPVRMIGTHTDISDRKASEEKIWHQAHFDALTGLPNRRTLHQRLQAAMASPPESPAPRALVFIDLDHFKEVNDTLGHDSGDQLLKETAQRIQSCLAAQDTVARMGGDEFTVLLQAVPPQHELEALLGRLLHTLSAAYDLGGEKVYVAASMGIALYPQDATDVTSWLKHADQALYEAKNSGRNRYSFFTPRLQAEARERMRLSADLRVALTTGRLELVYQPIVDLKSGAIHKAEALLRWHHPERGPVPPDRFIPIAESNGMIVDIGEWVFRQAAQQVQQWRHTLHPDFQVSVNTSPVQFQAGPLASWGETLSRMGLPGRCIGVEITEGLLLKASDAASSRLLELERAGLQIALDDFGTGYSSLVYLQRLSIDFLKIDRAFVRNLTPGGTDLALCKAIIVMAHELGVQVVAEGIETEDQRAMLAAAGCDFGQGYLFSRPVSESAFEEMCRK